MNFSPRILSLIFVAFSLSLVHCGKVAKNKLQSNTFFYTDVVNTQFNSTFCGLSGHPPTDIMASPRCLRFFTQSECLSLKGKYYTKSGECLKQNGGSYTYDCRFNTGPCQVCNIPTNNVVRSGFYNTAFGVNATKHVQVSFNEFEYYLTLDIDLRLKSGKVVTMLSLMSSNYNCRLAGETDCEDFIIQRQVYSNSQLLSSTGMKYFWLAVNNPSAGGYGEPIILKFGTGKSLYQSQLLSVDISNPSDFQFFGTEYEVKSFENNSRDVWEFPSAISSYCSPNVVDPYTGN